MNEDVLCGLFAERVRSSPEFATWMLGHTKFADRASVVRLLAEEQSRRPGKAWWRHWWCGVPKTGRQSETDIFLVFEMATGERFALHIENKIDAPFMPFQPEDYGPRAAHMANNRWVPYADFATMLIAPRAYLANQAEKCGLFDTTISHEEIAAFIPEYKARVAA
ncbi:MAG: hypothetical protein KDK08_28450 [Rhizobiaceae bacterium]|nr:hypothetical protein [Rhizobiaceae bacterium]